MVQKSWQLDASNGEYRRKCKKSLPKNSRRDSFSAGTTFVQHTTILMKKSLKGVLLVIFVGAFLIWLQEGNEDPSIATLAESLWWSFTTVVTGGFGDIYNPQTEFGRIITIFLVITGMILAGVFTATLTTIMTGEENEEIHVIQQNLEDKLERVEKVQEKILRELKKKS